MKLGFIGAGKMASAIAGGLLETGNYASSQISASDAYDAARDAFATSVGCTVSDDNATVVTGADVIILAIKPQDSEVALSALNGAFDGKLLISIAAGLSIEKLQSWSGAERVIRVMPNTPAMVLQGASAYAASDACSKDDITAAADILRSVGIAYQVPEAQLDAVTGLSGSGPAYVFEFIQALTDAAVKEGLDSEMALELVVQTVAGSAEMLKRSMGTPDELRNAVTSPNGTTAAGLSVLEDSDFRDLISRVVSKATARSIELGK